MYPNENYYSCFHVGGTQSSTSWCHQATSVCPLRRGMATCQGEERGQQAGLANTGNAIFSHSSVGTEVTWDTGQQELRPSSGVKLPAGGFCSPLHDPSRPQFLLCKGSNQRAHLTGLLGRLHSACHTGSIRWYCFNFLLISSLFYWLLVKKWDEGRGQ